MLELSRTVRFCLNDARGERPPRHNTFSAWPPMRGLGRYYELDVRCAGEADPLTGYFINIKHIDEAVRGHVLPHLATVITTQPSAGVAMGGLMRSVLARLQPPLNHSVVRGEL